MPLSGIAASVIHNAGSGLFTALMKLRSTMKIHAGIMHQARPSR